MRKSEPRGFCCEAPNLRGRSYRALEKARRKSEKSRHAACNATAVVPAGEFIRAHEIDIVDQWLAQASVTASARGLDRPELANMMPQYVRALGDVTSDALEVVERRRLQFEHHLGARIRQGFEADEIAHEFELLAQCVQAVWDRTPPEKRPSVDHIERVIAEIAVASASVAKLFVAHMVQDEQAEKRYLRLLQSMASESLTRTAPPLDARLNDALYLIMGAVGAACLSLVLYEPVTRAVLTMASCGRRELGDATASLGRCHRIHRAARIDRRRTVSGGGGRCAAPRNPTRSAMPAFIRCSD